jgi:hypothetical protein
MLRSTRFPQQSAGVNNIERKNAASDEAALGFENRTESADGRAYWSSDITAASLS